MSQVTEKTIIIKDFTGIQEERIANAEIYPGHLIEVMSTDKVRVHATEGGNALPIFAIENELEGQGIGDAYAAADIVQFRYFRTGDIVLGILADGESIAIGDPLISAGDGTVKEWAAVTESFEIEGSSGEAIEVTLGNPLSIIGYAEEALDLSGSSGEESSGISTRPRLKIRIR